MQRLYKVMWAELRDAVQNENVGAKTEMAEKSFPCVTML